MSYVLHLSPMHSFLMKPGAILCLYEPGCWAHEHYMSLTLEWDEIEVEMWEKPAAYTIKRQGP